MPWLPQSAIDRIAALESQSAAERESHARERAEVAGRYEARVRELERRVDWQADMLLRKAEIFPLPKLKVEGTPEPQSVPRPLSPTVLAKYEAIQQAAAQSGRKMNDPDVVQWVKDETGLTPSEIEQRLQQQLSSEAVQ
jgi:hypothetical protein